MKNHTSGPGQDVNSCLHLFFCNSYQSRDKKNVYLLSCRWVLISAIRICTFQVWGVWCARTCESMLMRSLLTSGFRDVHTNARHSNCPPILQYSLLASVVLLLPTPSHPTTNTTLSFYSPSLVSHSSSFFIGTSVPTGSNVGCQEPKNEPHLIEVAAVLPLMPQVKQVVPLKRLLRAHAELTDLVGHP